MARLRTARLTDQTLVSNIDDYVGELETDIAAIFGFTIDTDITASAFSCNNDGQLTKQLIAFRATGAIGSDPAGTVALSITNSTNSVSVIAGLTGVEGEQDAVNLGTIPIFAFGSFTQAGGGIVYDRDQTFPGFALLLNTGADFSPYAHIWGAIFSSSSAGLVPRGSGNAGEYLSADGTFKSPGVSTEDCLLTAPVDASTLANNTFSAGDDEVPVWTTETFDPDGLHATNDDEIIVVNDGKYLFGCQFQFVPDSLDAGYLVVNLWRDRSSADTRLAEWVQTFDGGTNEVLIQLDATDDAQAGDKFWVQFYYDNGGIPSQVYTLSSGVGKSHFYALRLS